MLPFINEDSAEDDDDISTIHSEVIKVRIAADERHSAV